VAVVDHTKLGVVSLATFVPLSKLHVFITDDAAEPGIVADLRHAGVDVRLVYEEPRL
jgi:DeoR/GlpR family transcriptional regulator of sugar metabolism